MDTYIITEILNQVTHYLGGLDWTYILTFILIGYGFNHEKMKKQLAKTGIKAKARYRMAIVGVLYGVVLYFIRGYEISQVELLFKSFVFAFVFHKMIVESLLSRFAPRIFNRRQAASRTDNFEDQSA